MGSATLVFQHSRGTSVSKFTESQGGFKSTFESCLSHTSSVKHEAVIMTKKTGQSWKDKFVVKNSLVKAGLSEFLGTFILIVSVSGFLPSWQRQPDRYLFGCSTRGAGQSMSYAPVPQQHASRGCKRAQPRRCSTLVATPNCCYPRLCHQASTTSSDRRGLC